MPPHKIAPLQKGHHTFVQFCVAYSMEPRYDRFIGITNPPELDMTEITLNYEAQAAFEERMLTKGVERYEDNAEFAHSSGDLSKAEERLFETALPKMVEAVRLAHFAELEKGKERRVPHGKAMEILDHTMLAGITLKNAFKIGRAHV